MGIFEKGCSIGTISAGLTYFNWTTWVTNWPISGRFAALLVSKRAPVWLLIVSGTAFTNLLSMLTMAMPFNARTASRA